jgi:hypothetical protein
MTGDRELWRLSAGSTAVSCWMITCCAGAELQVIAGDAIVLRELYPMKTDLYERARALESEYREEDGGSLPGGTLRCELSTTEGTEDPVD